MNALARPTPHQWGLTAVQPDLSGVGDRSGRPSPVIPSPGGSELFGHQRQGMNALARPTPHQWGLTAVQPDSSGVGDRSGRPSPVIPSPGGS